MSLPRLTPPGVSWLAKRPDCISLLRVALLPHGFSSCLVIAVFVMLSLCLPTSPSTLTKNGLGHTLRMSFWYKFKIHLFFKINLLYPWYLVSFIFVKLCVSPLLISEYSIIWLYGSSYYKFLGMALCFVFFPQICPFLSISSAITSPKFQHQDFHSSCLTGDLVLITDYIIPKFLTHWCNLTFKILEVFISN